MLSCNPMYSFWVNILWKLGIYPRETKIVSVSYFCKIILVLVIIVETWNKPICGSTHDGQINAACIKWSIISLLQEENLTLGVDQPYI